jgi:uncharacterized membrane protein YdjX (TVP38/TMEM64 family)
VEVSADGSNPIQAIADPEQPLAMPEFLTGESAGAPRSERWLPRAVIAVAGLLLLGGMVALWRFTDLSEIADPRVLQSWLAQFDGIALAGVVILGFLLGGLVAFPVTVMIAATALALGAWQGLLYATIGAVASAMSSYLLGRVLGTQPLRDLVGPRINRVSRTMAKQGIVTIVAVRLLPIAPFTLVNLVAGAVRVPFLYFSIGTVLGLAPGLLMMSVLGGRAVDILSNPSLVDLGLVAAVLALGIGLSLGLQRLLSPPRRAAA